jgi:hypothetical protein
VWRDILAEGPVGPSIGDPAPRAAGLARHLEIDPAQYVAAWHDAHGALDCAGDHDEVVLWFEQDLFCAVNLWYVLGRLAHVRAPLAVVYPSLDEVAGLGAAEPGRLVELFSGRAVLTAAAVAEARQAWCAYASATPVAAHAQARAGDGALPFVAAALRRHLARLPALATGLGEIEEAALGVLESAPMLFVELFGAVTSREPLRRHGMGDLQLAATVRALAAGAAPLVAIDGGALAACGDWRVEITDAGRAVVAGERAWAPAARWVGGVHVNGAHGWRRDGDRVVLTG